MITLSNGLSFSFIAAAGSRGWAGSDEGHGLARLWKLPFRFPLVPVVAKTVTLEPLAGNLTLWQPWRAVRPLPNCSLINRVGLTNPGIAVWAKRYYNRWAEHMRWPLIASIAPADVAQTFRMMRYLREYCPCLSAVELNLSCPNVQHGCDPAMLFAAAEMSCAFPLIAKLGLNQLHLCCTLRPQAFSVINAVPWESVLRYRPPIDGAVSGTAIAGHSKWALHLAQSCGVPVISGGGVTSAEEAISRFRLGAKAVSVGSLYLLRPWRVRSVYEAVKSL